MSFWTKWLRPNIQALRSRGDVPALIEALGHSACGVRQEAVRALSGVPQPVVIHALVGALDDHDEIVRRLAHRALVDLLQCTGGDRWMEQVAKGLHHAAPQVRRETVEVLADSGSGAAVAVLFDSYSAIGPRAEDALVRLGAGAVSYLEPLLSMEKLSEEKKAVALRVLSRIPGEQSRLALRRIAADLRVSSGLRRYAGKTVASGAGELTKVLRDQQEPVHVRLAAANLLAEHQDSSGTAALIEVLADGREEASLRRECARHLTGNSTPTIAQALAKQLRNPDNPADLRMACLPGVAMSGADEVVELLHGILNENPAEKSFRGEEHLIELRVQVVRALARFSGEQVLPALRTALHDPCTESHHKTHRPQFHGDEDYESEEFVHPVREAAAEVLRTIGGHEATSLLHAHAEYLERQGHMRRFD